MDTQPVVAGSAPKSRAMTGMAMYTTLASIGLMMEPRRTGARMRHLAAYG